eukprot:scaffold103444_cov32-Prasinocladus_malaysianus.AAC.1
MRDAERCLGMFVGRIRADRSNKQYFPRNIDSFTQSVAPLIRDDTKCSIVDSGTQCRSNMHMYWRIR